MAENWLLTDQTIDCAYEGAKSLLATLGNASSLIESIELWFETGSTTGTIHLGYEVTYGVAGTTLGSYRYYFMRINDGASRAPGGLEFEEEFIGSAVQRLRKATLACATSLQLLAGEIQEKAERIPSDLKPFSRVP
jgi:hypothetical protein